MAPTLDRRRLARNGAVAKENRLTVEQVKASISREIAAIVTAASP
jgi:hypothetical protein